MIRVLTLAALLVTTPPPEQSPSAPGVSTPVLTLWIAGGVGLVVGLSFGIKALVHQTRANDLEYVGGQHQVGAARTSQLIANIGYGVGLASLAAGLVMQRLFPEHAVTILPGPNSVGLLVPF